MKQYELRDPIHSRIPFDDEDRTLIDHPFVQRLRFISQLSFLQSYVYPGGVHDRFGHCLGAMHIATRLFGRLVGSSDELRKRFSEDEIEALRRRVRWAGLLHDIGHGPFSHSSESVFPELSELPLDSSWWKKTLPEPLPTSPLKGDEFSRQAKHEDYSVLLVQTLADEGVLEREIAQDIASLIHGQIKPSESFKKFESKAPTLHKILKSLISGEVDCDRMDYLLRDSYYCGVAYGNFDVDWLISSLGISEYNGQLILTLNENGVRAFEDMLLARYHMIDQVYFHKTEAGFVHYLQKAIEEGEIDLKIPTDPYLYADMRDAQVIEMLFSAAKLEPNYWSSHLMQRIPAKRILRLHDASPKDIATLEKLKSMCNSAGVNWFTHSAKNQLSHFGEGGYEDEIIHVLKNTLNGAEFVPVLEYSDLLQKYNEKIRFTDFFVLREDFERFKALS
ncbi:MAG: HD domain-containing protein [Candidatus Uhrbacteria bacterium]|nr:HD domain-containing protein [Candidatus Uhrbacteria bacterium]